MGGVRKAWLLGKVGASVWVCGLMAYALAAMLWSLGVHPTGKPWQLVLVSTGLTGALSAAVIVAALVRPILAIERACQGVIDGHLETRVGGREGQRRHEFGQLGATIDRMLAHVQRVIEARQALLQDVSHDLRSPLTRMQAAIGLVRQDHRCCGEMLDRIDREAQRLDRLLDELLTLYRLEAADAQVEKQTFSLVELLEMIAEDASFEGRSQDQTVLMTAPDQFLSHGNEVLVGRAIQNVVGNALKFSPPGSCINIVSWVDAANALLIEVRDRGPGVPPQALQAIFEPFVRVGEQALAGVEGAGLGLAIAKKVFVAHGGSIRASNRMGGGLVVSIRLPAAIAL